MKYIKEYAFHHCEGLTSITILESMTSIGNFAFDNCINLTAVHITDLAAWCNISFSSEKSNPLYYAHLLYLDGKEINDLVIPDGLTSIARYAFFSCSSLTSITIPNSVTNIGYEAFSGCAGLTSITIPNSVTIIDYSAFSGCTGLTSVTIPNSVTSIGESAFNNCTLLTSVTIGNGMTSIDNYAFYNCENLTKVTCYAEEVPVTATNAFDNSNIASATLYVPTGSVEAYKAAQPWSIFGNIQPKTKFDLTYIVDDEVYKTYEVEQNTPITPEPAPTKEGYTFSGWSEIPETMPAHDVTVTGYFIPNNYSLTYFVDGQVYKTYTVAYGSAITPEPAPTKEGYTFSGWTYIPPTMPASDVVVMGSFTINSYTLTYKVDGQVYKTYSVEYGAAITPEPEPTKEGYTFSGWSTIPATMPAHNVTVTGTFTKIIIKCATPTISYANGKLTFNCETEDVNFNYNITDTDIKSGVSNEVDLTVTYHISVYATKEDFEDSEVATGTLCWIDQQPSTEGIVNEDAVTEVKALPVLIQSNRGIITVQGANEGTEIMVYSVNGMKLGSAIATQGLATISTSLQPGSTAIVKIGEKAIKVLIK